MIDRIKQIKAKGFDLTSDGRDEGPQSNFGRLTDYGSIKLGTQILTDAILTLQEIKKAGGTLYDK